MHRRPFEGRHLVLDIIRYICREENQRLGFHQCVELFENIFFFFFFNLKFIVYINFLGIGKMLVNGRQEDAHEFLKLLLDHMEKSYLQFRKATKLDHLSKQTTPLNQIFGGYLRQQGKQRVLQCLAICFK